MSSHLSDQMSQWSQVSRVTLIVRIKSLTEWLSDRVSEWQGHLLSCQTLLWTAKKTRTMSMTNFIDQKLFAKCEMHFCMQGLLVCQLFYIGATPVGKSSGGVDEIPRLLVCPKSVDDDDCMHALTGWRGVNCSLSLALPTFAQMSPLAQSYKWRKLRGVALPPYKGVPHTLPPLDDLPTSWFHLFFLQPNKTGCVCAGLMGKIC